MSTFGLGTTGFRRKRYADIIAAMETRARNLFGESINLAASSPLGIFLRIIAWSLALAWEVIELVYHSAYVDTATGDDLDKVAKYIGIVRRAAIQTTGEITVAGDVGATVPLNFLVATIDGIEFLTTESAEIPGGGSIDVAIRAVESGTSGNVPPETITVTVTPEPGVDSVSNSTATTGGQDRETDAEFRRRYEQSTATGGASTINAIRAALLAVTGVQAALVVVNSTMEAVGDQPAKSIQCFVLGGEDEEIAAAILGVKAAGIQAYGTETVAVLDDAGTSHDIGFSRATQVDIEVDVELTTDSRFPEDGLDQVRAAIINYIGGEDEDGTEYAGLGLGEDVIYTRLIAACFGVAGVVDVTLTLNVVGEAAGTANVSIDPTEVAKTIHTAVAVTEA